MPSTSDRSAGLDIAVVIGARVRQLRKARSWTQDELCAAADVSKRTLIAVEQGKTNASIELLLRLSTALGVSLAELVSAVEKVDAEVRRSADAVAMWQTQSGGRAVMVASTPAPQVVELWDWVLGPRDVYQTEPHSTGTRELLHVLQGSMRVVVDGKTYELAVGDSIQFRGDLSHSYANVSDAEVRFSLAVYQPV